MYLLGLQNEISQPVRDALVDECRQRGQVATVRREEASGPENDDLRARCWAEGGWEFSTPAGSFESLLDVLAAEADFALIEGELDDDWPTLETEAGTVTSSLLPAPVAVEDLDVTELVDRWTETIPWKSLQSLVAEVKSAETENRAGAIATFTGRVRARDEAADTATEYLEFEAYGDVAAKKMRTIEDEIRKRDGIFDVVLHHRTGVIPAGEDIVFVVILAGHRDEAFEAVEDGINRLKAEVPIFKKEVTVEEEYWVHTRP